MNSFFLGLGFVAGALVFSTFESSATVVNTTVAYSTLDTNGAYSGTGGPAITGSNSSVGYSGYGNEFAPTVSGQLESIGIALCYVYGPGQPGLVNVQLVSDSGGSPYGTILASGSVMTDGYLGESSTALSIFTPSTSVLLTAGSDYWLLVTPSSSSSVDVWNDESSGVIGNNAATRDGAGWGVEPNEPQNAFDVIVATPEPSTIALALMGGLGLVWLRRRKMK